MIKIQNLPVIQSAHQLFDADKVLCIDVFSLDDIHHPAAASLFHGRPNTFTYQGKTYYLLLLKGSPENLILNAKKGVPFPSQKGSIAFMQWQIDLAKSIADQKIYDLSHLQHSADYRKGLFDIDPKFLLSRHLRNITPHKSQSNAVGAT